MRRVVIDFETYYDSKSYTLSKIGPIQYIRDPRFRVLCVGISVDGEPAKVFDGGSEAFEVLHALLLNDQDVVTIGHNIAGFDALILSEHYHIHPSHIIDTMHMARWCGVSRVTAESHKALTEYFGNGEKKPGTVVSDGKKSKEDFTPDEWEYFKEYCADDVNQCYQNFLCMEKLVTPMAYSLGDITAKMATEPAIHIDTEMLKEYIERLDARADEVQQELSVMFNFPDRAAFLSAIRSAPTFCNMLRRLGAEPPMKVSEAKTETRRKQLLMEADLADQRGLDSRTIRRVLASPESYTVYSPALSKNDLDFRDMADNENEYVAALVRARLELNSSIERSRAVRLMELGSIDEPMPVMLKAFSAHTGRYGAGNSEGATDGAQMQNLSKRDPNKLTLRRALRAGEGRCFVAVDSSQIEARMLAYAAGELELVEQFREGRDPYAELAEKIFGIPAKEIHDGAKSGDKKLKNFRNVGKTCILSAGYGVGARKFADTLLRQNVHLSEDLTQHYELAAHAHNVYRLSNKHIVQFWKTCDNIINTMYDGGTATFGHNGMFVTGKEPVAGIGKPVPFIELKGFGYRLWYPNLRAEKGQSGKYEWYYDRVRGRNIMPTKLYGGAVTENIIQSEAFMLLAWQAVIMSRDVKLIANIHDAWIAETSVDNADNVKAIMEKVMSSVPEHIQDFPVACEGEVGDSYEIA